MCIHLRIQMFESAKSRANPFADSIATVVQGSYQPGIKAHIQPQRPLSRWVIAFLTLQQANMIRPRISGLRGPLAFDCIDYLMRNVSFSLDCPNGGVSNI